MAKKLNSLAKVPLRSMGSHSSEEGKRSNWENVKLFPTESPQFTSDTGNFHLCFGH